MAYCMHCGHELPEGAAYCPLCDHPTPATLASRAAAKTKTPKVVWVLVGAGCMVFAFAFLGVISAILIPNFLDALHKAKQKRTVADLRSLDGALVSYWVDHEALPEGDTFDVVVEALMPDYMSDPPRLDGWKRPYRYECWAEAVETEEVTEIERSPPFSSCTSFRLASPGRDGVYEHETLTEYEIEAFTPTDYDRDLVFGLEGVIQYPGSGRPTP